ncbi:MAG: S9 family peptidase [Rhodanobacteraceae bacterium]
MPPARHIAVEEFFRKPEQTVVQISPDGTRLGWLAPWGRRLNVHVRDLSTGQERRVTGATARDVLGWFWASNDRVVYVQDSAGDENHRLYTVKADGTGAIDLTPFDGVKCGLVDDLPDDPDQILFQMNRRDPRVFDAYRANVATGELQLVAENPGSIRKWVTDWSGRIRAAVASDGVSTSLLYREAEAVPWETIVTHDFRETLHPMRFTFDDRRLFVTSNVGRDKAAVFEYDPTTAEYGRLIFEHPEADVMSIGASRLRKVLTVAAYETDKPAWHFLDPERQAQQEYLDAELPDRFNQLVSHSRDETRWVVHSRSDRARGSYYLLTWEDHGARRNLEHLFDTSPWLREEELAKMRPISCTSRDGLTIHGYLTVPVGAEPKSLPLLLNPHGGPWFRDSWRFNPEVQFLANRGCAVLQVNFRGSTGYGKRFWESGFGQWGLAMQDDLTDAVRWAVGGGIADPTRVAIYGGSYGGYATLAGITKEPDLFACAVSYCGVSNIFTWLDGFPPYWEPMRAMIDEMVGDPQRDTERLKATSPLFHVDRIHCPLLIAQGANDPRVRKSESDQIVSALCERGMDVEYLVKDNEGHGFSNEENQFDFYRAMERFLAKHLGLDAGQDSARAAGISEPSCSPPT